MNKMLLDRTVPALIIFYQFNKSIQFYYYYLYSNPGYDWPYGVVYIYWSNKISIIFNSINYMHVYRNKYDVRLGN